VIHRLSVKGVQRARTYDIDAVHLKRIWIKGYPFNIKFLKGQILVVPNNSTQEVVVDTKDIAVAAADIF